MPAHTPSGSLVVYTQAESRSGKLSPFRPPDATKLAKYSSTSAPVTMSTVLVSENGLPVSSVSMRARLSLRERRMDAARSKMRERSMGGLLDHAGKAACAAAMAALMDVGEVVWMVQIAWPVDGSMD